MTGGGAGPGGAGEGHNNSGQEGATKLSRKKMARPQKSGGLPRESRALSRGRWGPLVRAGPHAPPPPAPLDDLDDPRSRVGLGVLLLPGPGRLDHPLQNLGRRGLHREPPLEELRALLKAAEGVLAGRHGLPPELDLEGHGGALGDDGAAVGGVTAADGVEPNLCGRRLFLCLRSTSGESEAD